MAKKKITGQSKLAQIHISSESPSEELHLVTKSVKIAPTSFRLTPEDKQRLKMVTEAVNDLSPNKKISETMVIKALIYIGIKTKPEKLLSLIRDAVL